MHHKIHLASGESIYQLCFIGVQKLRSDLVGVLKFDDYLANFGHKISIFMQK